MMGSCKWWVTWSILACVWSGVAFSPAYAEETSWVGKTILTKKEGIAYVVVADQDPFIKVKHNGGAGWFRKSDAVLLEEAIPYFTERIRQEPEGAAAYNLRGWAWHLKGEYDRALADYNEAIRLNPNYAVAFYNGGLTRYAKKDYEKALADFDEAIRLDSKFVLPFNERAWIWATCPDGNYRDAEKAVESAKKACELSNWSWFASLDTLAAAYAEKGDFDEAVRRQTKALYFIIPGDEETLKGAKKRLELYKNRIPCREN